MNIPIASVPNGGIRQYKRLSSRGPVAIPIYTVRGHKLPYKKRIYTPIFKVFQRGRAVLTILTHDV